MTEIHGKYDPKFEPIIDQFAENFKSRGEIGAALAMSVEGEKVIDVWGGVKSTETNDPWTEDTICLLFSNTKAATALCAHILVERGQLDLNEKVTKYWPEFAANGKENVTVEMLLNHSVGLPALREPVAQDGFLDFDYMANRLAAEEPFWAPGTRNGYHMISFGWLVGEVIRRVSGKSLGQFFKDEIADKFCPDFWIGLPESELGRMATMYPSFPDPNEPPTQYLINLMTVPDSIQHLCLMNNGGFEFQSPEALAAEIGGGGGCGNARSLMGMFDPIANADQNDGALIGRTRIDAARAPSMETDEDATLLIPSRFGQGFMLRMDNPTDSYRIGHNAFGHVGMGGSTGFADMDHRVAFAYVMNNMAPGILLSDRSEAVIDTMYGMMGGEKPAHLQSKYMPK